MDWQPEVFYEQLRTENVQEAKEICNHAKFLVKLNLLINEGFWLGGWIFLFVCLFNSKSVSSCA